jgi:hypothetical protein
MEELRNTYDDAYMDEGKVYGGANKRMRIQCRFISRSAEFPPGPLLDLLRDLVDVLAVRYEVPPLPDDAKNYNFLVQKAAQDSSLAVLVAKHPVKNFNDRKENLKASWMLERYREAANSRAWNVGPEGQRFENPLTKVDEMIITTKRPSVTDSAVRRCLDRSSFIHSKIPFFYSMPG